jgi:dethiobiotin synthetase
MKPILITATNTDVGKTYTTLKLISIYTKMGYQVGVMKPIETGVKDYPKDATILINECQKHNPKFNDLGIEDICPIRLKLPAAPIVANNFVPIDLAPILESFKKIKNYCDLLLIESAGGILTPINIDFYMVDFAKLFGAKTLLLCQSNLGTISTTLLHFEYLKSQKIDYVFAFNIRDEDFSLISKPYFDKKFSNLLSIQDDLETVANNLLLQ